ncbi:S8 family peptidase [Lachnospiraceae bacterium OttesenSCG-928-D06]|nr:S8 family peptidase [Lachnospiraceae bacterium OttesenSCG-928-D06]
MACKERILSNDYADIIIDFPVRIDSDSEEICYIEIDEQFGIVTEEWNAVFSTPNSVIYYENMPNVYGLMEPNAKEIHQAEEVMYDYFDTTSLDASGITRAQHPPLSLTGAGVVICYIDTGIDYTHPVFRKPDGSSRILAIWDQTIQDGQPPEGFIYGTEYTQEEINRALNEADPYSVVPSRDENGHGSTLASVGSGSRMDGISSFLGAAPDSEIVVVKLKECKQNLRDFYLVPDGVPAYSETDIILAVKYGDSFVRISERPVVFCLGVQTNLGGHSNNSVLSKYLISIAVQRSRVVVVGGGDEGSAAHHYMGVLRESAPNAGSYENVEILVSENSKGFFMELWGSEPDIFYVEIHSPSGEIVRPVWLADNQGVTYTFVYEKTKITIETLTIEAYTGAELILFRVEDPTPGIWTLKVSSEGTVYNGTFHVWLPITQFLNEPVYFLEPDVYTTLSSPAMATRVLSVSTYDARNNSLYVNSGRGYSRLLEKRPDLSSPGVSVDTIYGTLTGSGLGAAVMAGGAAQFMQFLMSQESRGVLESRITSNYFIRGAARDSNIEYPNRSFGYGRLDVMGAIDALAEL